MKKKLLFPAIALSVIGVMYMGNANTEEKNKELNYETYIQTVGEKFNLSEDEVESIFNEIRNEYEAERNTKNYKLNKLKNLEI